MVATLLSTPAFADAPAGKALLAEARIHERAEEWAEARATYEQLEKIDGFRGHALYGEAVAAFQLADWKTAKLLAAKAIQTVDAPKLEAQSLYGDAIFKDGQYARAKAIYETLAKRTSGVTRAIFEKKIKACDAKLAPRPSTV